MPEAPEVETTRRALARALTGRVVKAVRIARADLRKPLPRAFAARLTGARVVAVARRAKTLLLHTQCDGAAWTALAHLGMAGRFVARPRGANAAPLRHEHLTLVLDNGAHIGFVDPRRFGWWDITPTEAWRANPAVARLGPDPSAQAMGAGDYARAFASRRASVRAALLNQSVVSGLGNIYVAEALWRAGVAPARAASSLGRVRLGRLAEAVAAVLAEAIAAGGATLRDFRAPDGASGAMTRAFAVYGRAGEPCLRAGCAGVVRRFVVAGRSSFACPRCQH